MTLMMDGGSDEAGFVQIIRGKLDDPDAIEAGMRDMESMLHEARPDLLGATLAIEDDGTFMETVFFTDEASAREAESKVMQDNAEAAEMMRQWEEMTHDVQYLDLHQPWFASKL